MTKLVWIDWAIIASILSLSLGIGVLVSRRAGASSRSFFLSGRNMPWWLLGVSMVATTFSTDTPNLVTEIVRTQGVAGNWIWWAFLITGMFTCFLYARLWRRSGATTTVAWVATALIGPRTDMAVLIRFYKIIRPQGPGWKTVRKHIGTVPDDHRKDNIPRALLNIFIGCLSVYALLFGVGYALYSNYPLAFVMLTAGIVGVAFLVRRVAATPAD